MEQNESPSARNPLRRQMGMPRLVAALLVMPAVPIPAAACFLVPWMLETRHRLQNDYWEGQLLFAIAALSIAGAGLPFLLLRVVCSKPAVATGSWSVVLLGYLAVLMYMFQSHFPTGMKLAVGCTAGGLVVVAGCALMCELSQTSLWAHALRSQARTARRIWRRRPRG
jgi:hypothetical protein